MVLHHTHLHYYLVVTFPAWMILFFAITVPLIKVYLYSSLNPYDYMLQSFLSISK